MDLPQPNNRARKTPSENPHTLFQSADTMSARGETRRRRPSRHTAGPSTATGKTHSQYSK
jgi:hypothetical protein